MARPKSDDKRSAIMSAAVRVIAVEGPSAATAAIAKEAAVSNGSLFTYFETKADLFNQLYVELKAEMAAAALHGLPADGDARAQMSHIWFHWLDWATSWPEKRRTLAQLNVSEYITHASRRSADVTLASLAAVLERCREAGPLHDTPLAFVLSLADALTEATIDYTIRNPADAKKIGDAAFEALWRILRPN
jgi:AcrR family transcriptional regulator